MIGGHTVVAYPDRTAGQWTSLASNSGFDSNMNGWKAAPFSPAWTWAGGKVSCVPTYAAILTRDPATGPISRPSTLSEVLYRIRAVVIVPEMAPNSKVRFNLQLATGATMTEAVGNVGNLAYPFTWWDLTQAGTYTLEGTFSNADLNTTHTFLAPAFSCDPIPGPGGTTPAIVVDSLEFHYRGGPGTDITRLVDSVAINHGRQDTVSQPEASSATVDFTCAPGELPSVMDVGAVIIVATNLIINDQPNTFTRFAGRITDIALGWDDAGEDTPEAGIGQFVAVGFIADLARQIIGDTPWTQELDGARVLKILTLAGVAVDSFTADPGTVQVIGQDIDAQPALQLATEVAEDAGGLLWSTRDGSIRYADADHRRNSRSAVVLSAGNLLVTPQWRRSSGGLVNDAAVGYGPTPDGGEQPRYRNSDAASIAQWGKYGWSKETILYALADATAMVNLLLVRNSSPVWILDALPIDMDGLSLELTQSVLRLNMHDLVNVTGLPPVGQAPTSAVVWVEGWTERLAFGVHEFMLNCSGYCRTAPPVRWDDTSPLTTWDTISPPEATWDDAACFGPPADLGRWDDTSAGVRWDDAPDPWDSYTTTPKPPALATMEE